jgi:hypothetical protein
MNGRKIFWLCLVLVSMWLGTTRATPLRLSDLADILPEWPVNASEAGGRLILSDSPENVEQEGILYRDSVKGDVRLFFHHFNAMRQKTRIVAMLTNPGQSPAKVEVIRYGISAPDTDLLRAGRSIQNDYLRGTQSHKLALAPGKSALLPGGVALQPLPPQTLLTGMIDFRADQDLQLVVAAIPEQGDFATVAATYSVLPPPPDKPHLRGSFSHSERLLFGRRPYNPATDGPVAITIGDGETDQFLTGLDATNGQIVRNLGNYGVVYRILLPTTGKGKIRCYLNPRGGVYAGWAAVKTKMLHALVGTPEKVMYFGDGTLADFELLAEFPAGESMWVTLSPPGSSNLPVRLMLVPAP